jgi:hypothetical protein
VRGVAVIGHRVAHARRQLEGAAVAELRVELSFEHVEHVTAIAPVVGAIAGRVLDDARSQLARGEGAGGTLPTITPGTRGDVMLSTPGGEGRYIRITLIYSAAWTMIDELEFF